MRSEQDEAGPAIATFATVNFILACLCALSLMLVSVVLVYGIGFSGDQGEDLAAGIGGCALLAAPNVLGLVVYLMAGLGLLHRRVWGYCFHCVGVVLTAFTCLGLIWTIPALIFALRPEFSDAFFHAPDQGGARAWRQRSAWDDA
jgi:hypothetical protein